MTVRTFSHGDQCVEQPFVGPENTSLAQLFVPIDNWKKLDLDEVEVWASDLVARSIRSRLLVDTRPCVQETVLLSDFPPPLATAGS